MNAAVRWFRRCRVLFLTCLAVVSLSVGCRCSNSTNNTNGAASSKPGSSWNPFAPSPRRSRPPATLSANHVPSYNSTEILE